MIGPQQIRLAAFVGRNGWGAPDIEAAIMFRDAGFGAEETAEYMLIARRSGKPYAMMLKDAIHIRELANTFRRGL